MSDEEKSRNNPKKEDRKKENVQSTRGKRINYSLPTPHFSPSPPLHPTLLNHKPPLLPIHNLNLFFLQLHHMRRRRSTIKILQQRRHVLVYALGFAFNLEKGVFSVWWRRRGKGRTLLSFVLRTQPVRL